MTVTDEGRRLLEATRKIERAEKAVVDLCSGKLRWEMQVPAEPDHDPDLIISDALRIARKALAAVEAADHLLKALEEMQFSDIRDEDVAWAVLLGGSGAAGELRAALAPFTEEPSDD